MFSLQYADIICVFICKCEESMFQDLVSCGGFFMLVGLGVYIYVFDYATLK